MHKTNFVYPNEKQEAMRNIEKNMTLNKTLCIISEENTLIIDVIQLILFKLNIN